MPRTDDSTALEPDASPGIELPDDPAPDSLPAARLDRRAALAEVAWRAHPPVLAAVGLLLLLVGIGWVITRTAPGAVVGDADIAVLQWVAGVRTPDVDALSIHLGDIASTNTVLMAGLLVAAAAALVLRRWWPAVLMAAALLGELVIFLDSATLVGRPRPAVPHLDPALPPTTSFPSGHTAAAVCLYGGLAAVVLVATRGWWRWVVLALAVAAVLAVAFARVYRAAHHPSDVLGGALLGVLWLTVVTRAVRPRTVPVSPG